MYYCNDFYGLNVLSLYEGELLGVVDKLYFDKKLKKLVEIELVGEEGNKLILPTKNIYHIGKNAITVKNNQAVSLKMDTTNYCPCPINSKAYTIKGEYLGVVKVISLNEKFMCEKFSLDNDKTFDVAFLASSGKNTTIFYTPNDTINVKKFTPQKSPKIFKSKSPQVARIMPTLNPAQASQNLNPNSTNLNANSGTPLQDEGLSVNSNAVEVEFKPNLQTADFLIGRVCTKDILNFNNEVLIKAQTIITKKNLKEINRFGKIRELMLYSK